MGKRARQNRNTRKDQLSNSENPPSTVPESPSTFNPLGHEATGTTGGSVHKGAKSPLRRIRPRVLRPCKRRESHKNFIPVKELRLKHFPVNIRYEALLEAVSQIAQLVVRVRSERSNGNQRKQSCDTAHEGRSRAVTCTGLATFIDKDHVIVRVPEHAMKDAFEAKRTTAEFFYDADDTDDSVIVQGVAFSQGHGDHTAELTCRTCPDLARRFRFRGRPPLLQSTFREDGDCDAELRKENVDTEKHWESAEGTAIVVISHPHGFAKKVTFGRCHGVERAGAGGTVYTDSTSHHLSSSLASPSSSSLSSSPVVSSSLSSLSFSYPSSYEIVLSSSEPKPDAQSAEGTENMDTSHVTPTLFRKGMSILRICSRVLSKICQLLSFLGRQRLCPLDASDDIIRLRHDAASCPGSSGGAVLLIGRKTFGEAREPMMSIPVFIHVGTVSDVQLGVAVPLKQ